MSEQELTKVKSVVDFFQKHKHYKSSTLFSENEPLYFWRLSDLNSYYPDIFNPKIPFSSTYIYNFNVLARTMAENQFKELDYIPTHFETVYETYNIYDSQKQRMNTIRNGKNQNLSSIACAYTFNKHQGYHIEQAYFLSPNDSLENIYKQSEEIKLTYARAQVTETMKQLSSLINRCSEKKGPNPYALIIGGFWNTMYNAQDSDELHITNNIKNWLSPLDYMRANTLIYVNKIFTNIIKEFEHVGYFTFDQMKQRLETAAQSARFFFGTRKMKPELCLFPEPTTKRINKIHNIQKNFLLTEYPKSLIQR